MQLMDTIGNMKYAINILGYWILDSKYENGFCLTRESLDLVCSSSIGEEQVLNFETVSYNFRYMWDPGKLKIG